VGDSEGVSDGTPVSANVGISEGAVLGAMDGSPRNIGSADVILVDGAAVRVLRSICGAAVAPCEGSTTRASIVTLASDLIEDRRLNDSRRRPGTVLVAEVVVHAAIDARR